MDDQIFFSLWPLHIKSEFCFDFIKAESCQWQCIQIWHISHVSGKPVLFQHQLYGSPRKCQGLYVTDWSLGASRRNSKIDIVHLTV
ncbi:hypothetical protein E4U13_000139 [Claviceps humidiphila]|uniref:Uncharacterized protein n=2 Tax=Claviceps TaxID=5110 RepID=A0A9P7SP73_9HYPO|nr:hypothetical protein E4U57_002221 [Claviceps arundinis]KAG5968118.1 hypothetical protein E4U56_000531 [Claviceps arundinis]KAG6118532.1 hypothetical protein E4U13_000139 [Claviceps humidiphila]